MASFAFPEPVVAWSASSDRSRPGRGRPTVELRDQRVLLLHRETGPSFHSRLANSQREESFHPWEVTSSSQKEGRETSPIYYHGADPSPREMHIPTGKQSCSWYQPEARRAGTTSEVSGGIRKEEERAGAPRWA